LEYNGKNAAPQKIFLVLLAIILKTPPTFTESKEQAATGSFRCKSHQFIDKEAIAIYLYCILLRIMVMEATMMHGPARQDMPAGGISGIHAVHRQITGQSNA